MYDFHLCSLLFSNLYQLTPLITHGAYISVIYLSLSHLVQF